MPNDVTLLICPSPSPTPATSRRMGLHIQSGPRPHPITQEVTLRNPINSPHHRKLMPLTGLEVELPAFISLTERSEHEQRGPSQVPETGVDITWLSQTKGKQGLGTDTSAQARASLSTLLCTPQVVRESGVKQIISSVSIYEVPARTQALARFLGLARGSGEPLSSPPPLSFAHLLQALGLTIK